MSLFVTLTSSDTQLFVLSLDSLKNLNTFVSLIVSSYPLYDAAETMYAIGASISKAMGGTTGIM